MSIPALEVAFAVKPPFVKRNSTSLSPGPVIIVVARAIRTIIEKISSDKTPRSYPMFRTINSIRPRVFMRIPIERESFQFLPDIRDAIELPPNLPKTATKRIRKKIGQRPELDKRPNFVLSPVNAKKRGSKTVRLKSSIFSTRLSLSSFLSGITTPAKKAPKSA